MTSAPGRLFPPRAGTQASRAACAGPRNRVRCSGTGEDKPTLPPSPCRLCIFWQGRRLPGSIITPANTARTASAHGTEGGLMSREFNVLALIKGGERYVFVYDDDSRTELIDSFRDQAADPRLSFNWFDAAVLTEKVREQTGEET